MTMITPSYLGETIEYSSLHACRSTLEDPTTDVWSRSAGQTRTTINFARATFNALVELNRTRITEADRTRLNITEGRIIR